MMYDTVDTVSDCTRIATGVVSTLKIKPDRMLKGGPWWAVALPLLRLRPATCVATACGAPHVRAAAEATGRTAGGACMHGQSPHVCAAAEATGRTAGGVHACMASPHVCAAAQATGRTSGGGRSRGQPPNVLRQGDEARGS